MNVKISVIIPIYNSERFLYECLESIKLQNFADFEAVLVDDGSTDNTRTICNEFVQSDDRFIYFHNENHGVGFSRNFGLLNSRGKYIVFVDSDDVCDKDFLNELYSRITTDGTDYAICGIKVFNNAVSNVVDTLFEEDSIISREEFQKEFLLKWQTNIYVGGPYNKIFKKSIIDSNNLQFLENINYAEDIIFNMEYLKSCNKISVCQKALYFYRESVFGSLTYKNFHNFSFESCWSSRYNFYKYWENYFKYIKLNEIELGHMYFMLVRLVCSVLRICCQQVSNKKEILNYMRFLLNNQNFDKKFRLSKGNNFIEQMKVFLCVNRLYIFIYIYSRYLAKN